MKQFILAALLVTGISSVNAQMKFGASFDVLAGQAVRQNASVVPFHGGIGASFFLTSKRLPFAFGYRVNGNYYSAVTKKEMPFVREDYVHEVADICNSHNITQNVLFFRAELNKNGFVSPYAEIGGGWANYKTRWSAMDPYERSNDNCEGYEDSGLILSDYTMTANGTAGVNLKFNNKKKNCSGFWLNLAVDYSYGQNVKFLNSKINDEQFSYQSGLNVTQNGAPRHSTTTGNSNGSEVQSAPMPPFFTGRHELVQFRVGFVMVIGNCD